MRIAYICADPGIPVRGAKGASVHLRSLASALAVRGHEVLLGCTRLDGPNPAPAHVSLVELPKSGNGRWLGETFSEWRIEAVIERYAIEGGAALDAAAALGVPYVLEVNAPLVEEAARFRGLQNAESWRQRERALLVRAGRIVVVSTALREHVIASGADAAAVEVIPNGVDVELFGQGGGAAVRARWGLGSALVIGFAGSLKPWHGVRVLLEAARELPPAVRVLVVGDGPEREALKLLASEAGGLRERVVFAGAVLHAEMPAYLDAMDVAVAPFEPLAGFYFSPLKVAEYMASGRPVVASRQGDLPDLLGGTGVLVEPGDAHALRDALLTLAGDADLRHRLGDAARARAQAMSWMSVAERVEGLIQAVDSTRANASRA